MTDKSTEKWAQYLKLSSKERKAMALNRYCHHCHKESALIPVGKREDYLYICRYCGKEAD